MLYLLYGLLAAAVIGTAFLAVQIVAERRLNGFANDPDGGLW